MAQCAMGRQLSTCYALVTSQLSDPFLLVHEMPTRNNSKHANNGNKHCMCYTALHFEPAKKRGLRLAPCVRDFPACLPVRPLVQAAIHHWQHVTGPQTHSIVLH